MDTTTTEKKKITAKRHLVCTPYSLEALHKMATELNIKKCWFHKDHYDIPKLRIAEITAKCIVVSPKEIVKIIKNGGKLNQDPSKMLHSMASGQSTSVKMVKKKLPESADLWTKLLFTKKKKNYDHHWYD